MKTKLLIGLLTALFFGVSVFVRSSFTTGKDVVPQEKPPVRICPNSGQPCSGGGSCGSGNGDACSH
ncbi:MAG: hypothetical protein LBH00_07350 [Planctomycetaceae bacterium]|nr:hypothetical protein [Planctomycetaceae bacterium]